MLQGVSNLNSASVSHPVHQLLAAAESSTKDVWYPIT